MSLMGMEGMGSFDMAILKDGKAPCSQGVMKAGHAGAADAAQGC